MFHCSADLNMVPTAAEVGSVTKKEQVRYHSEKGTTIKGQNHLLKIIFVGSMLIALHVDIVIKIDNLGFNTGGGVSFKDLKEASKKKYADVRGR